MAQTIFVFDFGSDEEAAQQARHKIDAWTQAFRLGKKITFKFDRDDSDESGDAPVRAADAHASKADTSRKGTKVKKPKSTSSQDKEADTEEAKAGIRVLIRLDFSDHEKLSSQQWLNRIPAEEPFKSAKGETIRQGSVSFAKMAERFDSIG